MLSDTDIIKNNGLHFEISPWDDNRVQPCSYDLTLSSSFTRYALGGFSHGVNPKTDMHKWSRTIIASETLLEPGELLLASTAESVSLCEHYGARLEGKSSLARLGLMVHTAGFVDAGFVGQLTLEITNHLGVPIWLQAGIPIAQICFYELSSPVTKTYSGKYQDQHGATATKYHENFQ